MPRFYDLPTATPDVPAGSVRHHFLHRRYQLEDLRYNAGLTGRPSLVLVHIASTNVPFTSESKDAIASIPEIEKEITLSIQELGRD